MNKIMFDIAINISDGIPWDIRTYAKILYKPFSIIEQEYKNMEHAGYVAGGRLTLKAKKYLYYFITYLSSNIQKKLICSLVLF